jgi:hypothetical protein
MSGKGELAKQYSEICEDCNMSVRKLLSIAESKLGMDVMTVPGRRVRAVIDADPTLPMKVAGKFLYDNFAEAVSDGDKEAFLSVNVHDYTDDEDVIALVDPIKEVVGQSSDDELEGTLEIVREIISCYAEYLSELEPKGF